MVTYEALFAYTAAIVGVISLTVQNYCSGHSADKKEVTAQA